MPMPDWSPLRMLCIAGALLVAPALAVWDGLTYLRLTSDGVTTPAVVMAKHTSTSRRSTSYYVEYRFRDWADRRVTGSQSVGHDLYTGVRVGQRIDIVYSRTRPDVNVAYMDVLRRQVSLMSCMSFVIALIAGGFTWWWHYAQAKTREHDAELMQRARTA